MTTPTQPSTEGVCVAPRGAQGAGQRSLIVGRPVRIARDEQNHPPRGTWPRFRSRTGTIVSINRTGKGATEYGVGFGKSQNADAWFKRHELAVV